MNEARKIMETNEMLLRELDNKPKEDYYYTILNKCCLEPTRITEKMIENFINNYQFVIKFDPFDIVESRVHQSMILVVKSLLKTCNHRLIANTFVVKSLENSILNENLDEKFKSWIEKEKNETHLIIESNMLAIEELLKKMA